MAYCSRSVAGQVEAIHPNLAQFVAKHLAHPYQRPLQPYNIEACNWLLEQWQAAGSPPIILDSGCGVGLSSRSLSETFADYLVIGIDQSLQRLMKAGAKKGFYQQDNLCLVRADLVDCWRLLHQQGMLPRKHFILYPNPWPKKRHLQRRWHGHPIFPYLIKLGGELEIRSNWQTYIDEFEFALEQLDCASSGTTVYQPDIYLTPFEKKYALSGQRLYRLTAKLDSNSRIESDTRLNQVRTNQ